MNTETYDSITKRAEDAVACPMKHYCERKAHIMNEWHTKEKGSQWEVWDTMPADAESEDDHALLFQSNDKSECERFLAEGYENVTPKSSWELRENGVCKVCDMYEQRRAANAKGKMLPYYIVCYGISRHYGGPEEGGWWYNNSEVLEVRRAFTLSEGLRHARELKAEYPQPRYGIGSVCNRGEPETHIVLCYGEQDPRWPQENHTRPRYE